MMFKGKFFVFVSFLILTVFACVSEAKTIYVPDDYSMLIRTRPIGQPKNL